MDWIKKQLFKIKAFKTVVFVLVMAVQLLLLVGFIAFFNQYFTLFYGISILLSIICVIWILNNKSNPSYKIAWIIPIMLFPLFGGLFYLFFSGNKTGKRTINRMQSIVYSSKELLQSADNVSEQLKDKNLDAYNQSQYLQNYGYYPLYKNTEAKYLENGEVTFDILLDELKKAECYIFLEYFIIREGLMWDSILDVLKEKSSCGVDIRIIYDDVGCFETLPPNYKDTLESFGIKCCIFNPMVPILSARLNNRDHRKIAVIDGRTGFVGGINLADEYINHIEKYGHWKDAAIMIKGESVWSLTVMFLSMWNYLNNESFETDSPFHKRSSYKAATTADGYLCPFADSPLDDEPISEIVYLNMINKAKKYVYITTPYLIIDNEMVTALCAAAKCGVDVRIITPHQWDKWYVHLVSKSYYATLLESGVKIYEYTPGFIHSKTFVADDEYGVVGTINMDYRSLYLHFECGIWLYRCSCINAIKKDFMDTLEISQEVKTEDLKDIPWYKVLLMLLLKIFAPLM